MGARPSRRLVSENRGYIRTTSVKGLVRAGIGGSSPEDSYARIIGEIRRHCGTDVATLFAEPVTANQDPNNPEVTWYTSLNGPPVDLEGMDPVAREPIVRLFHDRLQKLKPVLDDPEVGPTVASWLFIPSARDLLAVGGQPVLINWGYLPPDVALSPTRRKDHFIDTVGKYAPGVSVPISSQEDVSRSDVSKSRLASKAPLIASAIAAVALIFLLWPGVLLFPDNMRAREDLERRARLLRGDNAILDQRLKDLEKAANQKVCRLPNGNLAPLKPIPVQPDSTRPATPRTDAAPAPDQRGLILPPAGLPFSAPNTVTQLLENSVVFVFGTTPAGGMGGGSGFFVTPDRLVTNRHVIEDLTPDSIRVTSKTLGQALPAKVVSRSSGDLSRRLEVQDLALLAVNQQGKAILKLGSSPAKGSPVVAAGYPEFLIRDDPAFRRLLRGDLRSAPESTIQHGSIMQKQDAKSDPLKYLTHSANLGRGNSGGPLVDVCGRVIGVNTAVKNEGRFAFTANFAQDVSEIRKFLQANGIAFQADEASCGTAVAAASPSAAAPSPTNR